MNRDWGRLAQAIADARRARGWGQEELAEAAGVGRSTVQNLEGVGGYQYKRLPNSCAQIERALRWPAGTMHAVLTGDSPPAPVEERPVEQEPPEPQPRPRPQFAQGMPLRVADELASGDVVETVVMDLSDDSKGVRLVAVLKADDARDVDPDKMREALERWVQAERKLRGLPTNDPA